VLSCSLISRIDAISYLYYRGIAFVLTSNGYYFVITENDIHNKNIKKFDISGKVPHLDDCCDSALIKDLDECQNDSDNEHSIAFLKQISSQSTNYISLNITSLLSEDKRYLWSEPKSISSDVLLSDINIDYSKPIDAIFKTDNNGEIFFIQGEFYSGIEFHDSCPQNKDRIKVYERRKLSELNVSAHIDSAYYEPNVETNPVLYLTNYDKMKYFRVEIDGKSSREGKLVSLKTTTESLSSHPIFSRICAPGANRYNSSHLSAQSISGMTSNEWSAYDYSPHITLITIISYSLF